MPAAGEKFAGLIGRREGAVIATNLEAHALHRPANRHDRAWRQHAVVPQDVLRDQADLGGGKLVDELAVRSRVRAV